MARPGEFTPDALRINLGRPATVIPDQWPHALVASATDLKPLTAVNSRESESAAGKDANASTYTPAA
ncbi:hypothetical protein BSU04_12070 [Caballeronia sordidicola]|uniref:Uncharacterized protein n=1 Tax=Caballeronia sordidicola TaxID=196367 RepID=A0A226X6K0_CABSO|nr:hypothetical protein BSU04_12070 [Caballeronia sordidicola]